MSRQAPAIERQQCWGCFKRRWVCDSTKPKCSKCTTAGMDCPGYGEQKPIVWLRPGQVQSRRKRRSLLLPTEGICEVDSPTAVENLIPQLNRSLTFKSVQWDAVQAVQYYNTTMYAQCFSNQLEVNPWTVPVPMIHLLPDLVHHTFISWVLSHRVLKLPENVAKADVSTLTVRQYEHTGLAIQKLSIELNKGASGTCDVILSSILMLLYTEVQQSLNPAWWPHADGLMAIIDFRGGLTQICCTSPHFKPSMLALLVFFTVADTTSPPRVHGSRIPYLEAIELTSELYEAGLYPWFPCAEPLFLSILDINHLRHLHEADRIRGKMSFVTTVHNAMDRIESFCPKQWAAKNGGFNDDLYIFGQMYQSAVFLYALASLRSVNALQAFPKFNLLGDTHRDRLLRLVESGMSSPMLVNGITWPLIVAGFEAADKSHNEQSRVGKALAELSRVYGQMAPLTAKQALEKYWSKFRRGWNVCFDRPFAPVV